MKTEEFENTTSRVIPEKQFQQLLAESQQQVAIAGKYIELSTFIKDFLGSRMVSIELLQHFAEKQNKRLEFKNVPGANEKIFIELSKR